MKRPPKTITLNLQKEDVDETFYNVVKSMDKLRTEAINNNQFTNKVQDEYLHLTERLASCLEDKLGGKNVNKVQSIADEFDKDPRLLNYDSLQDLYWAHTNENFMKNLKEVSLTFSNADINYRKLKDHIIQAIKYIGSSGEEKEDRTKLQNTIKPFQQPIKIPEISKHDKKYRSGFHLKHLNNLECCLNKPINGEDFKEHILFLHEDARMLGYKTLYMRSIDDKEFIKIKNHDIDYNVTAIENVKSIENIIQEEKSKDKWDSWFITNGLSKFITYKMPENIFNYVKARTGLKYEGSKEGSEVLSIAETVFGTAILGGILLVGAPISANIIIGSCVTGCISASGIYNIIRYSKNEHCISPVLDVILAPLDNYCKKLDGNIVSNVAEKAILENNIKLDLRYSPVMNSLNNEVTRMNELLMEYEDITDLEQQLEVIYSLTRHQENPDIDLSRVSQLVYNLENYDFKKLDYEYLPDIGDEVFVRDERIIKLGDNERNIDNNFINYINIRNEVIKPNSKGKVIGYTDESKTAVKIKFTSYNKTDEIKKYAQLSEGIAIFSNNEYACLKEHAPKKMDRFIEKYSKLKDLVEQKGGELNGINKYI